MNSPNPVEQLSRLTDREREVLRLFCARVKYRPIAEQLVIGVNTVKSHIYNICRKLDILELPVPQRKALLYQVYCPALREAEAYPAAPDDGEEPETVPEDERENIDELEREITLWRPQPIVRIEPDPPFMPPPSRRAWLRPMILGSFLTIVGALLAVGAIYLLGRLRGFGGTPGPSQTPVVGPTVVVVTATPQGPASSGGSGGNQGPPNAGGFGRN